MSNRSSQSLSPPTSSAAHGWALCPMRRGLLLRCHRSLVAVYAAGRLTAGACRSVDRSLSSSPRRPIPPVRASTSPPPPPLDCRRRRLRCVLFTRPLVVVVVLSRRVVASSVWPLHASGSRAWHASPRPVSTQHGVLTAPSRATPLSRLASAARLHTITRSACHDAGRDLRGFAFDSSFPPHLPSPSFVALAHVGRRLRCSSLGAVH